MRSLVRVLLASSLCASFSTRIASDGVSDRQIRFPVILSGHRSCVVLSSGYEPGPDTLDNEKSTLPEYLSPSSQATELSSKPGFKVSSRSDLFASYSATVDPH